MDPTRRFWAMATAGVLLAALGVVFARPLLMAGAGGVGALLVARQYAFVRALIALDEEVAVEVMPEAEYSLRDDETVVTLSVTCPGGASLPLTVTAALPTIAGSVPVEERTIRFEPGEEEASSTFVVDWPVIGRATFDPPMVRVTDAYGLFTETYERGPERTVTVEARRARQLHVGEGGNAVSVTFGGHRTGQYGQGSDPAEIRQYVPGDSVRDIDWKATARMAYPHVREYEVESDRRTLLVVDHRGRMGEGPEGERKLDYLREVALTVAGAAERASDPLGYYAVGDEGLTDERSPSTTGDHYREVRSVLHELVPTEGETRRTGGRGISETRRAAAMVADDDSAFGETLSAYFGETERYVQRMAGDPLFETVRTRVSRLDGTHWVLVFTDDSDRTGLRETVRVAQGAGHHVVVFLAPAVLFEAGGLADLDRAYERYVDFEDFRRELARLERVSAYEVGPGERLEAVLSASER